MSQVSDLTPASVEDELRGCIRDMYDAQRTLEAARKTETAAEVAFKRAEARAFHRPDCPQPKRGEVTVGDRDAWVIEQVMDEWEQMKLAETSREVAQDNLRVILAATETWRSLGASTRTAYSVAGHA